MSLDSSISCKKARLHSYTGKAACMSVPHHVQPNPGSRASNMQPSIVATVYSKHTCSVARHASNADTIASCRMSMPMNTSSWRLHAGHAWGIVQCTSHMLQRDRKQAPASLQHYAMCARRGLPSIAVTWQSGTAPYLSPMSGMKSFSMSATCLGSVGHASLQPNPHTQAGQVIMK